jgi:hypothetical protein
MNTSIKLTTLAVSAVLASAQAFAIGSLGDDMGYEVWLSDQTNTAGYSASADTGSHGGRVHIYDSSQLEGSTVSGATNTAATQLDMATLLSSATAYDGGGVSIGTGSSVTGGNVVRIHGILPSPDHQYMGLNFVGSAHLAIVDGATKTPACLFRATGTTTGRQNHMSFWSSDGNYILVANQAGKMLERIDITRDADGKVTAFTWNQDVAVDMVGGRIHTANPSAADMDAGDGISCSVSGTAMTAQAAQSTTFTLGSNTYTKQATSVLTEGTSTTQGGDKTYRPNNTVICPLVTSNNLSFTTLGGGGALVVDIDTLDASGRMKIVGAYSGVQSATGAVVNAVGKIRGAGCGGIESGGFMYVNAGTPGANVSEFTMYKVSLAGFPAFAQNLPARTAPYSDPLNGMTTAVNGNRDAHGMGITASHAYIHQFDRVQNNVRVFPLNPAVTQTEYSLTTAGVCGSPTVGTVQSGQPTSNDPTPDLLALSPHGDRFYVALRGPYPLTVSHAALGSCPGLGIVELGSYGASGTLTAVMPTTQANFAVTKELSDPHAAIVRVK